MKEISIEVLNDLKDSSWATFKDIERLSGMFDSQICRVLNGKSKNPRPKTTEKIYKALIELKIIKDKNDNLLTR